MSDCPSVRAVAQPEPPLVSLSLCNQSLCVSLKPPADWLTELYKAYQYIVNISAPGLVVCVCVCVGEAGRGAGG